MNERANTPAVHWERPSLSKRTERRLWFGVLGAPIAWTVHELVGASVAGRRCMEGGSLHAWQWVTLVGVSVLAALVAAVAALTALGVYRERSTIRLTRAEGWDRAEFMAIGGVIISLALLGNIILMAVMPAIVSPCAVTT